MGAGPGGSPDDWLVLGSVPVEPWLRFRSGLGPAQRGEASGGQADAGAEQQRRGHPVDERRPRARCKGSAVHAELPCDRESAADAFADRFDDLTGQPGEIRACDGCHGVNSTNQAGQPRRQNTALALRDLLARWRAQSGNLFANGFE